MAEPIVTITCAASITANLSLGKRFKCTLDQNTALHVSGATEGDVFLIIFVQDGTGGRTVTIAASEFEEGKDSAFSISPEANSKSYVFFGYNAITSKSDVLASRRGY